jgi:hypothetical protein
VGSHVFYRFPNRSERSHYREAMARRLATTPRRRASPDEVLMEAAGVETQAVGQQAPAPVVAPAAPADADAPVETNRTAPAEAEVST